MLRRPQPVPATPPPKRRRTLLPSHVVPSERAGLIPPLKGPRRLFSAGPDDGLPPDRSLVGPSAPTLQKSAKKPLQSAMKEETSGESEGELPLTTKDDRERFQARIRSLRYWAPEPCGGVLGSSVLERQSVSRPVLNPYTDVVCAFLAYCKKYRYEVQTAPQVDSALTAYLNHLFFEGGDLAIATKTVFGWAMLFPAFGKHGSERTPRAMRCLRGYARLTPPRSRVGAAFFVVAAIAADLLRRGFWSMGVWVLVGLGGYLRPSSNMKLRKGCLVPPHRAMCDHWGLLLNPSEFHKVSKTRTSDDSIIWDFQELLWMRRVFPVLRRGDEAERVWTFDYPTVAREISRCAMMLGCAFVPYQLRHSGPSWERLLKRKSLRTFRRRDNGRRSQASNGTRKPRSSWPPTTSCPCRCAATARR